MKRSVFILSFVIFSIVMYAQDFDRRSLAEPQIMGSARYVALSGAMSAMGGDVSAAQDNPAALGVFRHGELSGTAEFRYDAVYADQSKADAFRFTVPQVAWVMHWGNPSKLSGLIDNSFMLQYHRRAHYTRNGYYTGTFTSSVADLMADLSNGLNETYLQGTKWLDYSDIGIHSKLGYEFYLINPIEGTNNWSSIHPSGGKTYQYLNVNESGSNDEFSFAWGGNIGNRLYLGAGLNIESIVYSKESKYKEYITSTDDVSMTNVMSVSAVGVNLSAGLIYRPLNWLRLSASIRTPSWYNATFTSYCKADSRDYKADQTYTFEGVYDKYNTSNYTLPLMTTVGIAFQIGTKGMISAEYDYRYQPKRLLDDIHVMKIGTEWAIKNNYFVRFGYAFQSDFGKGDYIYVPAEGELRGDLDFQNIKNTQYFSTGFGYRMKSLLVELAYQCTWQKINQYSFSRELQSGDYEHCMFPVNDVGHRVVISLGWMMR